MIIYAYKYLLLEYVGYYRAFLSLMIHRLLLHYYKFLRKINFRLFSIVRMVHNSATSTMAYICL